MLAEEILLIIEHQTVVDTAHFNRTNMSQVHKNIPEAKANIVVGILVDTIPKPADNFVDPRKVPC